MPNLTSLIVEFANNRIGNEGGIILGNTLISLQNLDYVELNLSNNYIDNVGFEALLDNLK